MPIYEYQCSSCKKTNEVLQKIADPSPNTCPSCNARGTLSKLISQTSFILKGGGWYTDAYSQKKTAKSDNASKEGTPAESSSSDSPNKSSDSTKSEKKEACANQPAPASCGRCDN